MLSLPKHLGWRCRLGVVLPRCFGKLSMTFFFDFNYSSNDALEMLRLRYAPHDVLF